MGDQDLKNQMTDHSKCGEFLHPMTLHVFGLVGMLALNESNSTKLVFIQFEKSFSFTKEIDIAQEI